VSVQWTGNRGPGTSTYDGYARDHTIKAGSKPDIAGSSDPAFRGDPGRWNPEELLVAAISACHKLWYLHLCADAGIAVLSYRDDAEGTMVEDEAGGKFARVILRPHVTVSPSDDTERAKRLHHDAHAKCYIANSISFPVECDPVIIAAQP
jgi:organic hydroperoxide reductase OsmC/OhrA